MEENAPAVAIDEDRTSKVVDAASGILERQAKSIHWWLLAIFGIAAAGFCTAVYFSTLAPKTALEKAVDEMNAKLDKQNIRLDKMDERVSATEKALAAERAAHKRIDRSLRWQTRATYENLPQRVRDRVLPPPPAEADDD